MIRQLPTECLWDVWRIVAPENQGSNSGELEFDIDTLPPEVVRELQKFVNQKCSQLSSKKSNSKRGANPGGFNGSANFGGLSAEGGKGRTEATEKSGAFAYSPADALLQSSPTRGQPGDDGERDRDPESSFISSLDDSDY